MFLSWYFYVGFSGHLHFPPVNLRFLFLANAMAWQSLLMESLSGKQYSYSNSPSSPIKCCLFLIVCFLFLLEFFFK